MKLVRRINHGVTRSYTELCAKFAKRAGCCVALALVLVFGSMFLSCSEPEDTNKTVNAQQPSISVQPADVFWNVYNNTNPINLSVTAAVTDGGELTYQWYSNTSNSASGGIAITTGGTDETLSLNKSNYTTNGSRYLYVVVTNTNDKADGKKTATITSAIAEVVVVGNPETSYTTSTMPENLKGTWTYDWGGGYIEKYIIDETTFTSENTYAGTIVGHRSNSDGAGYITIKFTENFGYIDSENMFYVIHYKDLSISKVTLAGAWLGVDPDFEYGVGSGGKTTQAEAEAVMTVSAGYFGMYSILDKDGFVIPLNGFWQAEFSDITWYGYNPDMGGYYVDSIFVDTESKSFSYYQDSAFETYWSGDIVAFTPEAGDEPAILIVKIDEVGGSWAVKPEEGKYLAYAYKNIAGGIVSTATAYKDSPSAKNTGVDTITEAISEYTAANKYFEYFGTYVKRALASPSTLNGIQGNFYNEDTDYYVQINGTTYIEFMDDNEDGNIGVYDPDDAWDMIAAMGLIVDCTDTSLNSGILYVQILGSEVFSNFQYIAVAWRNRAGNDIEFMTGNNANSTLAGIKSEYGDISKFNTNGFFDYEKQ